MFYLLNNKGFVGDVYFDDDEIFFINGGCGVDLFWLVVYELGYSFGFEYIYKYFNLVMFLYYMGYRLKLWLSSDDRNGI